MSKVDHDTMSRWYFDISKHLQLIEAGAEMAARHAGRLVAKPNFETLAEDELAKAERILEKALQDVREARAKYGSKDFAG
jgi:hypothetical protein